MVKVFTGKTKDVYELDDGKYQLVFKDDMTGTDGEFDPGANTVGLTIKGAGCAGLTMSKYYFKLIEEKGYPTHFISAEENKMTVKQAASFGGGLEVICRYKAMGSYIKRYGSFIDEGAALDAVIEMTLKDDGRGDPFINEDSLIAMKILEPGEYMAIKTLMREICKTIKADLNKKSMDLCDIKLEFGKNKNGEIILIDEISGGNMRVQENGRTLPPLELSAKVLL